MKINFASLRIKCLSVTETERRDLINKLTVMVTVGEHPNVLSLIGACTKTGNF